jgi:hypothetical protein
MRRISLYTLTIIFLFTGRPCTAQQVTTITNPKLELRGNRIHIIYDILNSDSTERFDVRMEITDSAGLVLDAKSLTGDIGESVPGGADREIVWSFQADQVNINGDLYIQIYAVSDKKVFSRTSLVLQSLVFPGLGLSRQKGNPHWIRGLAGYGCLAGSVILNRMAISSYEQYKDPGSAENAASCLEQARKQDQVSEVLAYTAAAIWISDIVWTLVGTSGIPWKGTQAERRGLQICPGFDPGVKAPMLALTYRF